MLKRLSFFLLAIAILIMVCATLVEKYTGSAATIYGSWWFAAVWALVCVCGLCYCLRRHLLRRPVVFLFHVSLVLILIGALITHLWGVTGSMHLRLGQREMMFVEEGTRLTHPLPFSLQLADFTLECYPGTDSPMDYISDLRYYTADGKDDSLCISMNKIGEIENYRFYQSGYDPDGQGTILAVCHDPVGIGVTYTGYGLLFVAMLLMLILPNEGFRRTLRRVLMLCLLLSCGQSMQAAPKSLATDEAHAFCSLYTYYNGRICPVQTVAKDFTVKLCGKDHYQGLNCEQVFAGWVFYPTLWLDEPMIKLKGEAAELLGIEGKWASYNQFFKDSRYLLEDHLHRGDRAVLEAHEKATLLQMLFSSELLRIYPYCTDSTQADDNLIWLSQGGKLPSGMPQDEYFFVRRSLDYVGELVVMGNHDQYIETIGKIRRYQQKNAHGLLPPDALFEAEMLYNVADYTRPLAMGFAAIGIMLFVALLYTMARRQSVSVLANASASLPTRDVMPSWMIYSCDAVLAMAACYLFALLSLRGYVSGHLPLSNGYETMQCMALVVLLLTLLLRRKLQLIIPFGFLLCGLTLLVSTFGQSNPQISHLMPVLASPLLSLHVCIIMVAYSLLAFCAFCGIAALILPKEASVHVSADDTDLLSQLTTLSRLLLYPALFCMAAGIFLGAIWANQSWGRYWGWDPKEVWALITLLVYSFAVHTQSLSFFRRPRVYHLYMVIAFLTVLMTYFGVNFLLGGMHSYANS